LTGVTAIDTNVAAVTVSMSAGLTTLLSVAVILLVPAPAPVARPPVAMVAVEWLEEAHATVAVRFCVLPSV
jgi:hypothetical protein